MCEVQCTKTNVNGCDAFSEYHFYLSKHKNVSVYNVVQRKIGRSGV